MTDEEFERTKEFILQQQAQFSVDIQQLKDAQADLTQKQDTLTSALATVVGLVGELRESQKQTDQQIARLTASQAETDERLNILIEVVERSFSDNGRPTKKKLRSLRRIKKSTNARASKSSRKKH
jgi:peptidoglycan hydrolase CwlO-like protein